MNQNRFMLYKIAYCIIFLAILSMAMVGCNISDYTTVGDFEVQIFETAYVKTYRLRDIAQNAKDKEELIIPIELNGIRVNTIGSHYGPTFKSPSLKKLFWAGGQSLSNERIIEDCVELDTVVFTSAWPSNYREFFSNEYIYAFNSSFNLANSPMKIILLDITKNWLQEDENYYIPSYIIDSPSPNVHYYYNFTSAPNAGYAWIDYIEAGEHIKTMPPKPTREDYEFTGWYSDEECTKKANLQTVVKEDSDLFFYAGWKQR